MIATPERARLIEEYEASCKENTAEDQESDHEHHDCSPTVQKKFLRYTKDLIEELLYRGNMFCEQELLVLQSNDIIPDDVGESIMTAEERGKAQYEEFVTQRFVERTVPLDESIKQN